MSSLTPRFGEYLADLSRERVRTIDFLVGLNRRLAKDIRYLILRGVILGGGAHTLAVRVHVQPWAS